MHAYYDSRASYNPPAPAEPASLCANEQKRGDAIGRADTMAIRLRPSPRAKGARDPLADDRARRNAWGADATFRGHAIAGHDADAVRTALLPSPVKVDAASILAGDKASTDEAIRLAIRGVRVPTVHHSGRSGEAPSVRWAPMRADDECIGAAVSMLWERLADGAEIPDVVKYLRTIARRLSRPYGLVPRKGRTVVRGVLQGEPMAKQPHALAAAVARDELAAHVRALPERDRRRAGRIIAAVAAGRPVRSLGRSEQRVLASWRDHDVASYGGGTF